ncbi:MAG: acyl carrier protein [Bacteroidales bacterium]|nr:acyl carrier protein [Bacteroidales bacterium]
MEKNEIVEVIAGIVRDILDDRTLSIVADTAPEDVDGWDSVTHVKLVTALEEKYDVKLSLREMMSWETVGDLVDTILNKVQNG